MWAAMTSLVERSSAGASAGRATLVHPTFLRDAPGIEASDGGRLIPFHAVRAEHLAGARGDALEAWVTADRMSAAVQDPDGTVTGAGIWVPGPARDDERRLVVRWQGERQSRTGPNGQTVHRLRLTVPYEGRTVAIHFICSYPSLYIHFGTDHRALRQRLERSQAQAAAALSRVGWRMDGWSVGDLEEADA
ncbi:hypothetical protein GCM10025857_04160 [Alicyclobacillus contaminans]|nr:hypothetical protein GCM10025857_04160 [Alicyclobacillus contaminans]